MSYAEIAVNSPVARRRTFSYSIPPGLPLTVGQAVWVPFGPRVLQGIVLELTEHPAVDETRDVIAPIDARPLLTPCQLELARWISDYYLAPLFDALALMLPPGFERRMVTLFHLSPGFSSATASDLAPEEARLIQLIQKEKRVTPPLAEKLLGKKPAKQVLQRLLESGIISKSQELEPPKVQPKHELWLHLLADPGQVRETMAGRAPKQAALLKLLASSARPVRLKEAVSATGTTAATARALAEKGLVSLESVEARRDPLLGRVYLSHDDLVLSPAQETALRTIRMALREPRQDHPTVFLLHGVTGSGKTEVYLRALSETVALGKRGLVLVPEISLTPQTIERFAACFPGRVAIMHSRLSLGEQFDEWRRIREGHFDVVIGPRGALFSPQPDLGLIVMDEEHEWTYKQDEQAPRYHAREVALQLARLSGATVLLGTATPDVESFYRVRKGQYHLLQLPHRMTQGRDSALPEAEVVDMREELKAGNRSIFSRSLVRAIDETLTAREQVILFLNRRGTATFVQCRNCGFSMKCPRCDLALTYHATTERLICHQCGRRRPVPAICPNCSSRRIRYMGVGTEKVEEQVSQAFPAARLLRWDRDVTRGKDAHQKILEAFRSHQADILIGTQMIAKGLDLPLVTLVGVISADTVLHLPDFRAGERTFQLLSQVAGRAGRGSSPGRVVVQTYAPEHYAIASGARHDYQSFYDREIDYRWQHNHPPFSHLVTLVYAHRDAPACRAGAEKMAQRLAENRDARGFEVDLIGPAPKFYGKLRGLFRWQIVLRGPDARQLLSDFSMPPGWSVDVDPVNIL